MPTTTNHETVSRAEHKLSEGEVHCYPDGRITYASQHTEGVLLHGMPATTPHTFLIFASTNDPPIGRLVRRHASCSGVTYVLYGASHNTAIAVIHYPFQVPNTAPMSPQPRRAQLALSRGSSHEFERVIAAHLLQHQGRLSLIESEMQLAFNSRKPDPTDKQPHWKLSMVNDRGNLASSRNMQILGRNGTVVCQMAASTTSIFHVDYGAPFTPLVAFGFALAQLDL